MKRLLPSYGNKLPSTRAILCHCLTQNGLWLDSFRKECLLNNKEDTPEYLRSIKCIFYFTLH